MRFLQERFISSKWIANSSIEEFLSFNESLLLKSESFHNLALGLSYGIRDKKAEASAPLYFSFIDTESHSSACAIRSTVDKSLILTSMPSQAVDELILLLPLDISSVFGPVDCATFFKEKWENFKGCNSKLFMHFGVYECRKVVMPYIGDHFIEEISEKDKEKILSYIDGFYKDCFPNEKFTVEQVEKTFSRFNELKSLYVLKNSAGEVLTMAANTRSTTNGSTISLVYTPIELRGKGYASLMVALLTQKIFDEGKDFANLFTDLQNPTSNSIYQKIGFSKIGETIQYNFIK